MIEIKESEKIFLSRIINNLDKIIQSGDVDDILIPIDEWITLNGFDEDYNLNDDGRIAQRIYDNIFYRNVPRDLLDHYLKGL